MFSIDRTILTLFRQSLRQLKKYFNKEPPFYEDKFSLLGPEPVIVAENSFCLNYT